MPINITIILCSFLLFGSALLICLYRSIFQKRSSAFSDLHRQAFHDVINVLEDLQLTYWITEGTLIGALRYGCNSPKNINDVIDDDIDIMIMSSSHKNWMEISSKIDKELVGLGWKKGKYYALSKKKGAKLNKLHCRKYARAYLRTNVDFHCYHEDAKQKIAYVDRDPDTYPFQYWSGCIPLEFIKPFKSCKYYERLINCPRYPISVLRKWNGGEYGRGLITLPLRVVTLNEYNIICNYAAKLHEQGFCSMYPELVKQRLDFTNGPFDNRLHKRSC